MITKAERCQVQILLIKCDFLNRHAAFDSRIKKCRPHCSVHRVVRGLQRPARTSDASDAESVS